MDAIKWRQLLTYTRYQQVHLQLSNSSPWNKMYFPMYITIIPHARGSFSAGLLALCGNRSGLHSKLVSCTARLWHKHNRCLILLQKRNIHWLLIDRRCIKLGPAYRSVPSVIRLLRRSGSYLPTHIRVPNPKANIKKGLILSPVPLNHLSGLKASGSSKYWGSRHKTWAATVTFVCEHRYGELYICRPTCIWHIWVLQKSGASGLTTYICRDFISTKHCIFV